MSYLQGFFLQILCYGLLWLWNPYVGFLVCVILAFICLAIVIFSAIAEKIEPSKVPRSYYKWMMLSIIPPVLVVLFFVVINEGELYWLN